MPRTSSWTGNRYKVGWKKRAEIDRVPPVQGRSQEFKGDKPSGDGSLQRGPRAEYGNPREHQRGRDKKSTYGDGDMHPCPPLATPLPQIVAQSDANGPISSHPSLAVC